MTICSFCPFASSPWKGRRPSLDVASSVVALAAFPAWAKAAELESYRPSSPAEFSQLLRRLESRWFLVRNVHAKPHTALLQPRWALSHLRGPMTQTEAVGRNMGWQYPRGFCCRSFRPRSVPSTFSVMLSPAIDVVDIPISTDARRPMPSIIDAIDTVLEDFPG
jgi:hypothetical protein